MSLRPRPLRPRSRRPRLIGLALLAALALAGCDSKAERAEAHRARAAEYLAEGQPERAGIELRNALRLDPANSAARLAFARLLRDQGDLPGALKQYAAFTEANRGDLDGQRELAALALQAQDFAAAATAARRAYEIAPADPGARALKAALDYRDAGRPGATPEAMAAARAAAVALARAAVMADPAQVPGQMVLIAERMAAEDPASALALAEAALAVAPADEGLQLARIAALERMGDLDGLGAALDQMAESHPDNEAVALAQVRLRLARGDAAGAEAVLRARADRAEGQGQGQGGAAADPEPALTLARFLRARQGPEAARAELDRRAAAAADPLPYRRVRAGLDFAEGDQAGAIKALTALTAEAEPSDAIRDAEVDLAAMLGATGDTAGRDARLGSVLAADPRHVPALKLRARAAIAADAPGQAVQDMRTALAEAPRDPEAMTILAEAHLREGARELAGERLALAVEASGRAPAESLRYARFLLEEGRPALAETAAADALRLAPRDAGLLATLGEIEIAQRDWAGAAAAAARLRATGAPGSAREADALDTARAAAEGRTEEARALIAGRAAAGEPAAMAALVEGFVAAGDLAGARAWIAARREAAAAGAAGEAAGETAADLAAEDLAAETWGLSMLEAGLFAAEGRAAEAEAGYRALIAADPTRPEPWRALFALLAGQSEMGQSETGQSEMGQGETDPEAMARAEAVLAEGRAATGEDGDLIFLAAGLAEARGDREAAIGFYETLYARDSGNAVVANNLADLLAGEGADPARLERAFTIARRLRGASAPQFQDTYGWILHLRGDSRQALVALDAAAAALPQNALVQRRRAEALRAVGRRDEARAAYARVLELAPAGPEAAAARARIAELDAVAPARQPG